MFGAVGPAATSSRRLGGGRFDWRNDPGCISDELEDGRRCGFVGPTERENDAAVIGLGNDEELARDVLAKQRGMEQLGLPLQAFAFALRRKDEERRGAGPDAPRRRRFSFPVLGRISASEAPRIIAQPLAKRVSSIVC